ncbi:MULTISPECIES: STAS-like domain-containing protein [Pseudomonas]|uniref:STAS-like domain-containing protein n=1 Tax=Pseudomonas TaxID=286 RepID=UPI000F78EFB7|nr:MULTISPECIES: STAS-like domain-containing protein [Pseudomonas]RRW40999.1 DUF4325 domain-containing protein [Pseudomonas luteola]
MNELKVADFSEFPGPRKESIGPNSGEKFRDEKLIPAIHKYGKNLKVNLDDTAGYGSSFLEEAFGGLIRCGIDKDVVLSICDNLISSEDPSLISEIKLYVHDEIKRSQ